MRRAMAAAVLVAALAACSSGDGGDAKGGESSAPPAAQVERSQARKATLGKSFDLDALAVTVSSPSAGGTQLQPYIAVAVDVVSDGDGGAATAPNINVLCKGDREQRIGSYMATSTYEPGSDFPAGSKVDGELQVLPTNKAASGEPVDECAKPAVFAVAADNGDQVEIPVPADVLDAYNELRG